MPCNNGFCLERSRRLAELALLRDAQFKQRIRHVAQNCIGGAKPQRVPLSSGSNRRSAFRLIDPLLKLRSARRKSQLLNRVDGIARGTSSSRICGQTMMVLDALKQDPRTRDVPVVVMSGFVQQVLQHEGVNRDGFAAFFPKPCLPDDLATGLRQVLRTIGRVRRCVQS